MKQDKKHIIKELEDLSPMIAKIKKGSFDDLPEDYFNRMQAGVLEQIKLTPRKQISPKSPWWTSVFFIPDLRSIKIGLTAAFSIILLVFVLHNLTTSPVSPSNVLANLTDEDIITYVTAHDEVFEALLDTEATLFVDQVESDTDLEDEIILENIINDLNTHEIEELF